MPSFLTFWVFENDNFKKWRKSPIRRGSYIDTLIQYVISFGL